MAVPLYCFCFSPFSNESPALLLAQHRDVLHPQVLTQVPVLSVPWATGPAMRAVLLLSTPGGAAGGVVPQARLFVLMHCRCTKPGS